MKYIFILLLLSPASSLFAAENVVPNKLIQLIIDHPDLEQYWHPEIKGRVPLNILHKYIEHGEGINKFNTNVVLIRKIGAAPYLEIERFFINNKRWLVEIKYPAEGVSGTFVAKMLPNRHWVLISASIVER